MDSSETLSCIRCRYVSAYVRTYSSSTKHEHRKSIEKPPFALLPAPHTFDDMSATTYRKRKKAVKVGQEEEEAKPAIA